MKLLGRGGKELAEVSDRFLKRSELRNLLGIADATIYRWIESSNLPPPIDIKPNSYRSVNRWLASEVQEATGLPLVDNECGDLSDRYLKISEVEHVVGLSHNAVYQWIGKGQFPKPVSGTGTNNYWLSSDIEAWMEERIQAYRSSSGSPEREKSEGTK